MKKIIAALILAASASSAQAYVQYYNGLWYGNICRTGLYYSYVPYQPVGSTCWNSAWGIYGYISNE